MKSVMDRLDEHFDTEEIPATITSDVKLKTEIEPTGTPTVPTVVESKGFDSGDLEDDYTQVRTNMYGLIDKGSDALESLLVVAKGSDHPRAYEAVSNLMGQLLSLNKEVLNIQSSMKHLLSDKQSQPSANSGQMAPTVVVVNNTAEIMKMRKETLKDVTNEE